ncbi:MAG: pyridoxamine 5'-phosphate oxidase family protein [Chloroflexi bacterium]|nr:pyridoxamine 5'-phosphate oxidase family protein [Chloroflexota bacterium]
MTYHEGELAVQKKAGVQAMARRIGRGIHAAMLPIAQDFLRRQILAAAGSVDGDGRVWASLLTGKPDFITALDSQNVRIEALPPDGDPLVGNLALNPDMGLIAIDFATRQRVRLNGEARVQSDGIELAIQQAYSNCPKYIQARMPLATDPAVTESRHTQQLTSVQQCLIAQADTFFIASYFSGGGADASHRGGNPGFVRVLNSTTLEFPDYSGNTMFNTLGNIAANPHAGLLFIDFAGGSTLQLSGQAEIIWDSDRAASFPGAERVVEFHIEQVIQTANAIPFRYDFVQYSPYNPPSPE